MTVGPLECLPSAVMGQSRPQRPQHNRPALASTGPAGRRGEMGGERSHLFCRPHHIFILPTYKNDQYDLNTHYTTFSTMVRPPMLFHQSQVSFCGFLAHFSFDFDIFQRSRLSSSSRKPSTTLKPVGNEEEEGKDIATTTRRG